MWTYRLRMLYILRYGFTSCGLIGCVCYISSDMDLCHVDLQVTYVIYPQIWIYVMWTYRIRMLYILRYGFMSCGLTGYVCYISSDMDLCHVDLQVTYVIYPQIWIYVMWTYRLRMLYILRYGFTSCGLIGYVCYISSDMDLRHVDLQVTYVIYPQIWIYVMWTYRIRMLYILRYGFMSCGLTGYVCYISSDMDLRHVDL